MLEIWHLQNESWESGLVLLKELRRIHSSSLLGSGKLLHHLISTYFLTTRSLTVFTPRASCRSRSCSVYSLALNRGDAVFEMHPTSCWTTPTSYAMCIHHRAESTWKNWVVKPPLLDLTWLDLISWSLPSRLSLSSSIKTYKCYLCARKSPIPPHANTLKR